MLKKILMNMRGYRGIISVAAALFFIVCAVTARAETGYQFITQWGTPGTGSGQFSYPAGAAVDTAGNVYIADAGNNRIQKFDSNGGFITQWGTPGTGNGQFNLPIGAAVDISGNVYIADAGNNRIQKFDSNGGFKTQWGTPGAGNGQFNLPIGAAVDAAGNVYIADAGNNRVQKFDSNGGFKTQWGTPGTGNGQFNLPIGAAVDTSGNVYITDAGNNRVQKFDFNGGFKTQWGASGAGNGQFTLPLGAAVDTSGNVYITDAGNNRVQKFDSNGGFKTQWGASGAGDGQFNFPFGMAVDAAGNVYVADLNNQRIQRFSSNLQGRIKIEGAEVTQTVQSLDNDVPLIAGKRTFIRVYMHAEDSAGEMQDLSGYLTAYRPDGLKIGNAPLQALNKITSSSSPDTVNKRRDQNSSLNFELPAEWTKEGLLHLILGGFDLKGNKLNISCAGCDLKNNSANTAFFLFQKAPPVKLKLVKVRYSKDGGVTYLEPRQQDIDSLKSWLQRAFPTDMIIDASVNTTPALIFSSGEPDCNTVNSGLDSLRNNEIKNGLEDPAQPSRYYGLIYADNNNNFRVGCAKEIPGYIASGPAGPPAAWGSNMNWDSDISFGGWYGGHELAHTYGRRHPGYGDCLGSQAGFDPDYPYAGGLLSGPDFKYFGFDAGDASNGILNPRVYDPANWTDVMTYRCKEWISKYTYEGILKQLNDERQTALHTPALRADIRADIRPDIRIADAVEVIHILGTINLTKNTVELNTFSRLADFMPSSLPVSSPFTINFFDNAGNAVAVYPFEPKLPSDSAPDSDTVALLSEVVPLVPGTRRITISRDGNELASRKVGIMAPAVWMTFPYGGETLKGGTTRVTWDAITFDEYAFTYTLLYSADAGKSWETVGVGIREPWYEVNLEELPGSDAALFRVIASDGVNTGTGESNAVFHVPFKSPRVRIISPADNSGFMAHQTIVFHGEALDRQDGSLDGDVLQWSSDKQGLIGLGRSIASKLIPGRHVITLSARNKAGLTGRAVVQVESSEIIHMDSSLPIPANQQTWTYHATSFPVKSANPEEAAPVGVGPIAAGGNALSFRVGLEQFSGPVDVYLLYMPQADSNVFIIRPDLSIKPLAEGLVPWKVNVSSPIDEPLPVNIPNSDLSAGTHAYSLGLLAAPAGGDLNGPYYLWVALFELNIINQLSLTLNPASLPAGSTDISYNQSVTMEAAGGMPLYVYSCTGSGVSGLTAAVSGNLCRISGTPTVDGKFTVTFRVKDSFGTHAQKILEFNVVKSLSLRLTPASLPPYTVCQFSPCAGYQGNVTMEASGGRPPYNYSCSGSGVPGFTAGVDGGAICYIGGQMVTEFGGRFTVTFSVQDAAGTVVRKSLSVNIP